MTRRIILILCFASVILFVTSNIPARQTADPVQPGCEDVARNYGITGVHYYQRGIPFHSFGGVTFEPSDPDVVVICGDSWSNSAHWWGFAYNAMFWIAFVALISHWFPKRLYLPRWLIPIVCGSALISLLGYYLIVFSYE